MSFTEDIINKEQVKYDTKIDEEKGYMEGYWSHMIQR